MTRAMRLGWAALLAGAPAGLFAQGISIDHKAVGCIVAEKYPKLDACFAPLGKLARSRVYFRAESGGANWYYVEMKPGQPCHAGILPKPKKTLIGQKIFYYIDAFDQQFVENRTPDNAAEVVRSERECKKDIPAAPFVTNASVTVFPALPAGFGAAGLGGGAVTAIAVGGAAAVGGGVVVAAKGGNDSTTTTTTNGGTPSTGTLPPPPEPTPTPTPTPTPSLPFSPSFRILPNPPVGLEPLRVEFNMCASQGTNLKFTYDFDGDGIEDFRGPCRVVRTFTVNGFSSSGLPPAPAPTPPPTLPKVVSYDTVMTVFEQPDNPRPPVNTASQHNTVTVTQAASRDVGVFSRGAGASAPSEPAPARRLSWTSQLDVPGASGQLVMNGTTAAFVGTGRSSAAAFGRKGENRIEAQLVQGAGQGGTWRFELGSTGSFEPGSLHVIAGSVALVGADAIVFRLSGRPGERVVFTFRTGN